MTLCFFGTDKRVDISVTENTVTVNIVIEGMSLVNLGF